MHKRETPTRIWDYSTVVGSQDLAASFSRRRHRFEELALLLCRGSRPRSRASLGDHVLQHSYITHTDSFKSSFQLHLRSSPRGSEGGLEYKKKGLTQFDLSMYSMSYKPKCYTGLKISAAVWQAIQEYPLPYLQPTEQLLWHSTWNSFLNDSSFCHPFYLEFCFLKAT